MERREILKIFTAGTIVAIIGKRVFRSDETTTADSTVSNFYEDIDASDMEIADSIQYKPTPAPDSKALLSDFQPNNISLPVDSGNLQSYLQKMDRFENFHHEDVFLSQDKFPVLLSTFKRLGRVQNLIGHGNFNVVGFDEMLKYSEHYSSVGAFPRVEIEFLEQVFSANAKQYGFFGDKVIDQLSAVVPQRDYKKMPHTGHFLYRGDSEKLYLKLRQDVGQSIVLTSGIRSVVKQTHLFLAKTVQSKGNLSRASRSLAPPGYSFHGIGDFDVGKVGFGSKNFTSEFSRTREFEKLVELGYIDMRYPRHNLLGVRYEPWHIKVV
jgi:hypothetical protein